MGFRAGGCCSFCDRAAVYNNSPARQFLGGKGTGWKEDRGKGVNGEERTRLDISIK